MNDKEILGFPRSLAGLFAVAALLFSLGGWLVYRHEAKAIRAGRYAELSAIAELKTGQIDGWRRERLGDARVNSFGDMGRSLAGYAASPADTGSKNAILARLRLLREAYGYQNIILAAPDGRELLSLEPGRAHLGAETTKLIARALASRETAFGDFFRCGNCGKVHLDIAAPVIGPDKRATAALVLRTDPEQFLYPLIQSWPMPSRTAETLLIRREGENALFLNKLRHRPDEPLTISVPLSKWDVPAVQAALRKTGLVDGCDYRGEKVLADIRQVPGTAWYMVAKVDSEEIFSGLRLYRTVIVVFVVFAILLAGVAGALLHNIRQKKLYMDLDRAQREMFEARDEIRATLYGIGDGVIAVDTQSRVTRMNPVAVQLTGWPEKEALGRPLAEVFQIISELTRAVASNPAERVLQEGLVVGLANHTLLISRDKTERAIADSGAPIRGADGKITGVVLVFRDQTAERKTERTLEDSELRHRAIFETSRDIIIVLEPQPERPALIRDMNPAGLKAFGYPREEIIDKSADILSGNVGDLRSIMERFRERQPADGVNFEVLHKRKDGTLFTTEASVREMLVGGRRSATLRKKSARRTCCARARNATAPWRIIPITPSASLTRRGNSSG